MTLMSMYFQYTIFQDATLWQNKTKTKIKNYKNYKLYN